MLKSQGSGWVRLTVAISIVIAGLFVVTPSLEVDSDGDGAADVVEINNLGTDPSKPDLFGSPLVAEGRTRN